MRMTHEADYAIRVVYCLAESGEKMSAKEISDASGVTLRFALKILRSLFFYLPSKREETLLCDIAGFRKFMRKPHIIHVLSHKLPADILALIYNT